MLVEYFCVYKSKSQVICVYCNCTAARKIFAWAEKYEYNKADELLEILFIYFIYLFIGSTARTAHRALRALPLHTGRTCNSSMNDLNWPKDANCL